MPSFPFEAPLWLVVILFSMSFIFIYGRNAADFIDRLRVFNRIYDREKKKLELQKLHYEIEVIKKQHNLETITTELDSFSAQLDQEQTKIRRLDLLFYDTDRYLFAIFGGYVASLIYFGLYLLVFFGFPDIYIQLFNAATPDADSISWSDVLVLIVGPAVLGTTAYSLLFDKLQTRSISFLWSTSFSLTFLFVFSVFDSLM